MDNQNSQLPISDDYKSWAERNGFADWGLALIWIIIAFVSFQLIASIVAVALIIAEQGASFDPTSAAELMLDNLDIVFIGNSAGQILFLGLATWFFTRLHTRKSKRSAFLRLTFYSDTWSMAVQAALLIICVQPLVWFLAWVNAQVPVPEFFEQMQTTQMDMIEKFLKGDHVMWLTLFHVGAVPAVCEEVLYRGYVMRAFEKSWGIIPAILLSGLLFGLYHIQLTNLLPLAMVGILLAYITWVSRSLYPAMLAHFINNGGSVLVGSYYPDSAFAEITPESMPPLWAVLLSLVVSFYIIKFMYSHYQQSRKEDKNV